MHAPTYLLTIEGRLAEVMEQRGDYQALTWEAKHIGSEHRVENFEAVHHQSMVSSVMAMALGSSQVVAGLDEIDDRADSWTVDF